MPHYRLILALAAALAAGGCASLPPSDTAAGPTPDSIADIAAETATADALPPAASAAASAIADTATEKPAPPSPPADLWSRLREGFQMQQRSDPRVEGEIKYFSGHPDYIARTVDRAEPYLRYIVEEVDRRGLPMELALLPVIESAFQPHARSHAKAAGIWQFIPSTGAHFGLKQNWWYDGRRDVIASTAAALDYLERLYKQFSDWELALAAYNAGEGTVQRAIDAATRAGKPTDYWNLKLPRETRDYVPRLLAIRALVETPEAYGLALRSLPDEQYLAVVELGSQIDLKLVSELAGLSLDEVYRLNPGFNRWATDPDGPHLLLLPVEAAEPFEQALGKLPASRRVHWERHRVRRGDTLSEIAQRYRTTVAVVKRVNQLRGSFLRAGQDLLVPATPGHAEYASRAPAKAAAPRHAGLTRSASRTHKVRPGDTLWDLARKYEVTPAQIARWNRMAPRDILRVGQTLVIGKPAPAVADSGGKPGRHYTVRRGDSLYVIAQRFGVSVADLREWNRLPSHGYLQPGQQLTVAADRQRDEESI